MDLLEQLGITHQHRIHLEWPEGAPSNVESYYKWYIWKDNQIYPIMGTEPITIADLVKDYIVRVGSPPKYLIAIGNYLRAGPVERE